MAEGRRPSFRRRCAPFRLAVTVATLALPTAALQAQTVQQRPAADPFGQRPRIDGPRLLRDLGALAHDSMEGRRSGTPGAERARAFLARGFEERRVQAPGGERTKAFDFSGRRDTTRIRGVNVAGIVEGTVHPDRYLVVTAHYDHLGTRDGEVFNGADDNASGSAALLTLSAWFRRNAPRHSILFVAFDAEEMGLQGARAFTRDPPVPLDRILLNVNLDMVSRSERGELYVVGTHGRPALTPLVEEVAKVSRTRLLRGHDRPDLPAGDDWTLLSDHGAFHQAGVPFLYFGVEDHPGYHQASDDADRITPDFYVEAVETVLDLLLLADRRGDAIFGSGGPDAP